MIGFKHYYKSDEMIGTGDYVFRRVSSQPPESEIEVDSRFISYISGTLEEILPEDFGNIATIPDNILCCLLTSTTIPRTPFKVTLPDTVTTIGNSTLYHAYIKEVVFPANISDIYPGVMQAAYSGAIADFSKAKNIPTLRSDDDGGYAQFTGSTIKTIKVPSGLYSSWSARSDWSHVADKLVSV